MGYLISKLALLLQIIRQEEDRYVDWSKLAANFAR